MHIDDNFVERISSARVVLAGTTCQILERGIEDKDPAARALQGRLE